MEILGPFIATHKRLLLILLLTVGATVDCEGCEGQQFDFDGDNQIGVTDLSIMLTWWGTNVTMTEAAAPFDTNGDGLISMQDLLGLITFWNLDLDADNDGVLDCDDDCVGIESLVLIDIITTYDSVFIAEVNDWYVFIASVDSVQVLECDSSIYGCTDPNYIEYNPLADTDNGDCLNQIQDCGNPSIDNYTYSTIQIGGQCWFSENLRTTKYRNNSPITLDLSPTNWSQSLTGEAKYCYYENELSNVSTHGNLYNWYAVNNNQAICPIGWHIPSVEEFDTFATYVNSTSTSPTPAADIRAEEGWPQGLQGTDSLGFTLHPSGARTFSNNSEYGQLGIVSGLWSSTFSGGDVGGEFNTAHLQWIIPYNDSIPLPSDASFPEHSYRATRLGHSARCLKDTSIILGCTQWGFLEYSKQANSDDGSCLTPIIYGCTNPEFIEFNPTANTDDGTCDLLINPCTSPTIDDYVYNVVQINDQCWFAENLRSTRYRNGQYINTITPPWQTVDQDDWAQAADSGSPAVSDEWDLYGRYYNQYALHNESSLCPLGWHVSDTTDWNSLREYLSQNGYNGFEATVLKVEDWVNTTSFTDWIELNQFGFSARPGGRRSDGDDFWDGFSAQGTDGHWWVKSSSTESPSMRFDGYLTDPIEHTTNTAPGFGLNVRCVRDPFGIIIACLDSTACNYEPEADFDSGNCEYQELGYNCNGECIDDVDNDGVCDEFEVPGCTDPFACDFDPLATDSVGCEDPSIIFDGFPYTSIRIGTQCWIKENLRTEHYANGDSIPQIQGFYWAWLSSDTGATCYYEYPNGDLSTEYGRLYNWNAVVDDRGLCPTGWHVPEKFEYDTLVTFLGIEGGLDEVASALMSAPTDTPSWNGNNASQWSGLAGGMRGDPNPTGSQYYDQGVQIHYWSSTNTNSPIGDYAKTLYLPTGYTEWIVDTVLGLPVRCVSD